MTSCTKPQETEHGETKPTASSRCEKINVQIEKNGVRVHAHFVIIEIPITAHQGGR